MKLNKLFLTTKVNKSGCYAMRLLVNGCYQVVVVDDYVPYDVERNKLMFANIKTMNIWPILLEKAWAKINGSYEGICGGSSSEALNFLMPYPIERSQDKKEEEEDKIDDWSLIKKAIKSQHLAVGATGDNDSFSSRIDYKKIGIAGNHGFSITGQYSIKNNREIVRLL